MIEKGRGGMEEGKRREVEEEEGGGRGRKGRGKEGR